MKKLPIDNNLKYETFFESSEFGFREILLSFESLFNIFSENGTKDFDFSLTNEAFAGENKDTLEIVWRAYYEDYDVHRRALFIKKLVKTIKSEKDLWSQISY